MSSNKRTQPSTGAWPLLDKALCYHLYAASLAMHRFYRPILDGVGLSYPQFLLLVALMQKDDQTVKELGQVLRLDSGTLSPMIKRLQGAGFVTKRRDAEDERLVRIALTPRGRACEPMVEELTKRLHGQLGMTAEGRDELIAKLAVVIGDLGTAEPDTEKVEQD